MGIQFDHTVPKINKDGKRVLSNTLEKGEKLATGETYAQVQRRMKGQSESSGIAADAPATATPAEGQALTLDPSMTSSILSRDAEKIAPPPLKKTTRRRTSKK